MSKEYVGNKEKLKWKCLYNHEWLSTYNHVVNNNTWCPECNINLGEEITKKLFELLFEEKFIKCRLKILDCLELDGYCESLKLAFEYDGEQHYKFVKRFHGTLEKFEEQKLRDIKKNKLCITTGIKLIRVPYTIKFDDIKDYVIKKCKENNIEVKNKDLIFDYRKFSDMYEKNKDRYEEMKNIAESKEGNCSVIITFPLLPK